jgi:hypothetical protein
MLDSFVLLRALLELVQLSPGMHDKFTWRFTPEGSYSVSSAYHMQFAGSIESPFAQLI